MDLDTIAIGNGSAQKDYGSSFDGFLASIQVGAFIAAIQIGGFVILRRRYRGKCSCLDAIGLFVLLRLLTRIFGLTAIFMLPLLVPLNYVHHRSDSSIRGLDKFSCLNILENNTGRLWAHLTAACWFTSLFCLSSRRELANFVDIRRMHEPGTVDRLYLVTDIPERLEKASVESMFHTLYPCQVQLYSTRDKKAPFVGGKPYLRALTQIEKEASRRDGKKVYSFITPLALLPSSLGLFALLMAIKPALRQSSGNAAGNSGEIFSNIINQVFVGLYTMQLCLAGIFISVESKTARFALGLPRSPICSPRRIHQAPLFARFAEIYEYFDRGKRYFF
ncbi:hypothetical protein M436DRAFT_68386 [Aureobasidium namibiae CBS 147.97]|uniref:CSC1/OSCA1-like N-terminal transmembrane domain-containing protein n=1 Tax=Aureobasidium namibiae CBS 147.97 TaxID=1043004 RepID=A0A074W5Q7_9PEZI|nr:uncharacterized protein M436DRAFT_68386 [Aureobasidium namibiae CBS 147.97]KEQ68178.1 hypothetical protein M436DRAFT_68386 [Aureobasidium namibiae CBS 147.97]